MMAQLHLSKTKYAKWWNKDGGDPNEKFTKGEIKCFVNLAFNRRLAKSECDPWVLKNVLTDIKRITPGTKWRPREWLNVSDFSLLCDILSGGSRMSNSKLCYACGEENSFEHATQMCSVISDANRVNLCALLDSAEACQREMPKVRRLHELYCKNSMFCNYANHVVTVYEQEGKKDWLVLAHIGDTLENFRCLALDSYYYETKNLKQLHRRGKLYVHPGMVSLENVLDP
jgi:hypothetical protein